MPIVVSSTEDLAEILADIKARLKKTLTAEDGKLSEMIDAAVDRYVEKVGPLTAQTHTAIVTPSVLSDGFYGVYLPYRPVRTITSVTDGYGTTVASADYLIADAEQSQVRPAADGLISLTTSWPSRLVVTYTYGGLDDYDREVLMADVAGYFAATQRGGGQGPSFSSEGYELPLAQNPMTLFPRIDALGAERHSGSIA